MKINPRFALICLLPPLCIVAFYEESKLALSAEGHTLAQIMIWLGAIWLTWRWIKYDQACYLREYLTSKPGQKTHLFISAGEFQVNLNNQTIADQHERTTTEISPRQHESWPAANRFKNVLRETPRGYGAIISAQINKN